MSELKLENATIRLSNKNDVESPYRISANIHINEEGVVIGVRSGNVRMTETSVNVAAFDCQEDGNSNYQFSAMTSEEKRSLMDAIDAFVTQAKNYQL